MVSSVENLKYHLVFATKYRYNLISEKIAICLKNYFFKQQEKLKFNIISLAIETNHIHILFELTSSQQDLNKIIQKLKGGSSFFVRKNFKYLNRYSAFWTASHFISTTGNVSKETIQDYINAQGIEKETIQRTFKFKILTPTNYKENVIKTYFQECVSNVRNIVSSSILQDFYYHKVQTKENEITLYVRKQNAKLEKRNTKLAKYWFRLAGSHKQKPIWLGLQGRTLPDDCKIKDSLLKSKGKEYYLLITIEQERIIPRVNPQKILSIDLGLCRPIASVMLLDDVMKYPKFYGKEIKNTIHKRRKRQAQLQHSGVEEPNLERYSRNIDDFIHNYVSQIIKLAKEKDCSIVVGKLGLSDKLRKGKSSKRTRQRGQGIPYFRIQTYLQHKATIAGIPIVFVPEYYTSQRCSKCGVICEANRNGNRYECGNCGYSQQADLNGAINIAKEANKLLSNPTSLLSISQDASKEFVPNTSLPL
jgi:IS605 OrfB family transposase